MSDGAASLAKPGPSDEYVAVDGVDAAMAVQELPTSGNLDASNPNPMPGILPDDFNAALDVAEATASGDVDAPGETLAGDGNRTAEHAVGHDVTAEDDGDNKPPAGMRKFPEQPERDYPVVDASLFEGDVDAAPPAAGSLDATDRAAYVGPWLNDDREEATTLGGASADEVDAAQEITAKPLGAGSLVKEADLAAILDSDEDTDPWRSAEDGVSNNSGAEYHDVEGVETVKHDVHKADEATKLAWQNALPPGVILGASEVFSEGDFGPGADDPARPRPSQSATTGGLVARDAEGDSVQRSADPALPVASEISASQRATRGTINLMAQAMGRQYKKHNGWRARFWNMLRRWMPMALDAPKGHVFKAERAMAKSFSSVGAINDLLIDRDSNGTQHSQAGGLPELTPVENVQKILTKLKDDFVARIVKALKTAKAYKAYAHDSGNTDLAGKLRTKAQGLLVVDEGSFVSDVLRGFDNPDIPFKAIPDNASLVKEIVGNASQSISPAF